MLEFDVQRCSRRCAQTGRELQPGDEYVSVLVPDGGHVVRKDYAADAWTGPPEQAIGWWRAKVPEPSAARIHWAPNDVLLDYFQQLANTTERADERYVVALLLVRRRILRLEETRHTETGQDLLILSCPRTDGQFQVVAELPDESRMRQIQEGLGRLLAMDGPATAEPVSLASDSSAAPSATSLDER